MTAAHAHLTARLRAAGCVFAEEEASLLLAEAGTGARLETLTVRRVAGEPLEHVLGWAEFCGMRVAVRAGVFVPRRRSEFLVHLARGACSPGAVVVDLCCGTGALGLAIASGVRGVELHAADLDPVAVTCAADNLAALGGLAYVGDLFSALPGDLRGRVDLLVANVPYVPSAEVEVMPAEARLHEPRPALDGGPDGLDIVRRVATQAPGWLAPGGVLLVETTREQAPVARRVLSAAGLSASVRTSDEFDATVVRGNRPTN